MGLRSLELASVRPSVIHSSLSSTDSKCICRHTREVRSTRNDSDDSLCRGTCLYVITALDRVPHRPSLNTRASRTDRLGVLISIYPVGNIGQNSCLIVHRKKTIQKTFSVVPHIRRNFIHNNGLKIKLSDCAFKTKVEQITHVDKTNIK